MNEKLFKINHDFPPVQDCIQLIGQTHHEVMSVADLRDAYHTLILASDSQKYCSITPFQGSLSYLFLTPGMCIIVSPDFYQQLIDKLLQTSKIENGIKLSYIMP